MRLNLDALIRLLLLAALGMACALILQPFAEIVLWAGLLAVILKPLQLWLQQHLRLGRWWSAGVLMLAGLLVLLGPVGALAAALLSNVSELVELVRHGKAALPQPPPLLLNLPVIGSAIQPIWHDLISDLHGLLRSHSDTLTTVMTRVLETTLAQGLGFLRLLLSLLVAALMLVYSEPLLLRLRRLLHRLAPEHAETVQQITATTVRNVSRGVVGVAFLQSLLIGLGLIAADVPWSGLLTLVALILCLMQIGPLPVVLVALVMAWSHLPPLMALLLTLWLLAATLLEHLLKPLLMARGLPVPMLVILVGVLGGTLKAGLAGLFLGPVLLSLGYHFVRLWVGTSAQPAP
ncbi:MAG: AI-2E family transporter [Cyanobacteria bacterium K_DeepCast_150m_m2_101]|nr:AI-2E family transporter [Cyanobacteria bacterium K_DeepCast_0m_m1_088]MBM5819740.1 AI-2E family transporter [Cyanobacteria bacterium K_DeepCast_150m_m2_101]